MALPDPKGDLVLILKHCDPCIDQMDYMYQLVLEYTVFKSATEHSSRNQYFFVSGLVSWFF